MTVARLIRDKLAKVPKPGVEVVYSHRGDAFHRVGLIAKMHEETCEIEKSPGDVEEYADLIECVMEYAKLNGIDYHEIERARLQKRVTRGGFETAAFMVRR